jgi:hypothetical protein
MGKLCGLCIFGVLISNFESGSMKYRHYNSLAEAVDDLTQMGYKENFRAEEEFIVALHSGKSYKPGDLVISEIFRFEGMTDPADSTQLMAIETKDGTQGTLVLTFGAKHSQNEDLIRKIEVIRDSD